MSKFPPRNGKKAFVTGITGQDGSYLAELLLEKGYEVWGMIRRSSSFNTGRIDHIYQDPHDEDLRLRLCYGDLNDASSINHILRNVRPDEIYNLGAQSHVKVSFEVPEYTGEVTGLGTVRILEAIREAGLDAKFYQASSSELYGKVLETPQSETTPFLPPQPLCGGQGLLVSPDPQLSRVVRHVCGERHSVQPRISPPGRDLRHSQDQPCSGTHQARHAEVRVPGQPRRQA